MSRLFHLGHGRPPRPGAAPPPPAPGGGLEVPTKANGGLLKGGPTVFASGFGDKRMRRENWSTTGFTYSDIRFDAHETGRLIAITFRMRTGTGYASGTPECVIQLNGCNGDGFPVDSDLRGITAKNWGKTRPILRPGTPDADIELPYIDNRLICYCAFQSPQAVQQGEPLCLRFRSEVGSFFTQNRNKFRNAAHMTVQTRGGPFARRFPPLAAATDKPNPTAYADYPEGLSQSGIELHFAELDFYYESGLVRGHPYNAVMGTRSPDYLQGVQITETQRVEQWVRIDEAGDFSHLCLRPWWNAAQGTPDVLVVQVIRRSNGQVLRTENVLPSQAGNNNDDPNSVSRTSSTAALPIYRAFSQGPLALAAGEHLAVRCFRASSGGSPWKMAACEFLDQGPNNGPGQSLEHAYARDRSLTQGRISTDGGSTWRGLIGNSGTPRDNQDFCIVLAKEGVF